MEEGSVHQVGRDWQILRLAWGATASQLSVQGNAIHRGKILGIRIHHRGRFAALGPIRRDDARRLSHDVTGDFARLGGQGLLTLSRTNSNSVYVCY
jgi:hypothetical protein